VYVDKAWLGKLDAMNPDEDAMLGLSTDRQDNSRLSCQIRLRDELDGIAVTTPEFQF
jgi:2Fe-2S ferredoxin